MTENIDDLFVKEPSIYEPIDHVKKQHTYKGDSENLPLGLIIQTENGTILFNYVSQEKHIKNKKENYYLERKITILTMYQNVSFDSFFQAEEIYIQTGSLDKVDKFLSLSQQELIGEYRILAQKAKSSFLN